MLFCRDAPQVYSEDINNIISSDAVNEDNIRSRLSDDSIVNEYGRTLIDLCITHDLLIVNGRTTSELLRENAHVIHIMAVVLLIRCYVVKV